MQTSDYQKLLAQLREHQIDHLDINPDNFMPFQRALATFESRKRVIGRAHLNGKITYTFLYDD